MIETVQGFDWDRGNRRKCTRHGVSIAEVEAVFAGESRVAPDLKHSRAETRFVAIGRGLGDRPVFVAFTFRIIAGHRLIRPISARYMHAKEIARYDSPSS
jgi:uncharacterized protein